MHVDVKKDKQEKQVELFNREYTVFYGDLALLTLVDYIKEDLGKTIRVTGKGRGALMQFWVPDGIQEELVKLYFQEMKAGLEKPRERVAQIVKKAEEHLKYILSLDVTSKTSDEQLSVFTEKYCQIFREYGVELWRSFFLVVAGQKFVEEKLLREYGEDQYQEVLHKYSYPSKKTSLFIIADFFKREEDIKKRKEFVRKKFPWLTNLDPFSQPMTQEWLDEYVSTFSVPSSLNRAEVVQDDLKDIIGLYQDLLYLKDARDDYRREVFYHSQRLFEEIAKRLHLSFQGLKYLRFEEFLSLIKSWDEKKAAELIRGRDRAYLIEYGKDGQKVLSGSEALISFGKEEINDKVVELNGVVCSSGLVRGKVKVIQTTQDLPAIQKGDILVSHTTNPNYIVAMQKAAAFVTDEGGITCHAAIVAREMNKPAVVGTKLATKILKDGDEVEVDADKGIVKILK